MTRYRWRTVYWKTSAEADGDELVEVDVAAIDMPETAVFLEHVYDRRRRQSTRCLIVRTGWTLHCSDDLGETWREIEIPHGLIFSKCFTTDSGKHLLQTTESPEVHVFTADWSHVGPRPAGAHRWHGTWSIDQSESGTIMFCEYADASDDVRVLRSTDDGESWQCAFSQPGHESDPAAGVIRHFHTCQADPFVAGRWYLSSGDRELQNRLWYSNDDGLSWQRARPKLSSHSGFPVPEWRLPNVLRHTAEVITEDEIVWPTDDNLASAARLVRLDKRSLDRVDLIQSFGANELRNIIVLHDHRFFLLSESKLDPQIVEAYCVDAKGGRIASFAIENESRVRVSFARSSSSKSAVDGVFFSFCDLPFDRNPALLRWTINIGARNEANARRLLLRERIEKLRSRYGRDDTEVWVLEEAYMRHFQCNVCSDELRDSFLRRPGGGYEGVHDVSHFRDEYGAEYPCFHCDSRVRQRTARILLDRDVLNRRGRALLVSTAVPDRRWLVRRYRPITHVALHGEFGDPDILQGTDITDMPHIESNGYEFMYATVVLDYIPDLEAVAREAYRVLRSGGEFAFFIMPYRLVDSDAGCVVQHRNALAHEAYAQTDGGAETGIPSCVFGVRHIVETFRRVGFLVDTIPVFDPLSLTRQRWFVARKPLPPPPWRRLCAPPRGIAVPEVAA